MQLFKSKSKVFNQLEFRKTLNLFTLLFPATFWLILFLIIPLIIVLVYSFLERGTYGGVEWIFTLEHYLRLVKPIYWVVFFRSLWLALLTTFACLIVGYPLAFFIATRSPRWRNVLLLLVIIPFWTNFLVRIYAWIIVLRQEGVVNVLFQSLNIIDQPLDLLFTSFAVSIGLVYGYLPFMILPLYATIERFDFSFIEAAQDLGANDLRTLLRVVLPLTTRGMLAGSLLVFIPAVGEFITPDILGGAKTLMMGNLVQNQFLSARNWPFGSVLSMVMMAIVLAPILISFRLAEDRQT
ncbi:ABC transporter permease [Spirulina sp. CS-785/01]|uniref:ABC transporter permease n=1 Tax=Spirulina sp. CS-785/01 TaxID=3021716 RepID=UPI00232C51AA|nr:ABC transporter permease [Spirulina sp. CS-785/01]MDB9314369.1 ABC transporter permease [Spirulina sp. CS-785/01]